MRFLSLFFATSLAGASVVLRPPKAAEWRVTNDQTERGGTSTGQVTDIANGIEFTGSLGSIPGRDGKPVAFSLARFDFKPATKSEGLRVRLSSREPITALVVVATAPPPRGQPVLTYQKSLRLDGRFQAEPFQISWLEFEPTVRGKKVEDAPRLDVANIESWAIQVTRSSQPDQARYEPIEFQIRVLNGD